MTQERIMAMEDEQTIEKRTDIVEERRIETVSSIAISKVDEHNTNIIQGKVHGSLARAGKVKSQTPKVDPQEKPKKPKGRAYKRLLYTRRFVNVTLTNGKRKMNPSPTSQ